MNELIDDYLYPDLPAERMIQPHLLLLLGQKPAHGYELIQRLNEAAFTDAEVDPATVYRNLRRMDREGLVSSRWEAGPAGPARRLYALTPRGEEFLQAWAIRIQRHKEKLESFLQEYHVYLAEQKPERGKT